MNERMSYENWNKLTIEEQQSVPEDCLPEIPQEMLTNCLTSAVCKRMDGVIGWETTQRLKNGSNTRWFPVYKQKEIAGMMFWYRFDPTSATYSMNLTESEPTLDEEPIGVYGMRWMDFMEKQYPDLVELMQFRNNYLTVARSVDRSASAYRELLDEQYAQTNPRPTEDYEEIRKWEETRKFYTDGTVMRERVLIPVTTP